MARVDAFNKGRVTQDDEYYTRYEDIQNELNNYRNEFEGKTVFCNCDDPYESNFCKFFLKNFIYLKLKKLICTSYGGSPVIGKQMRILDDAGEPIIPENGYVIEITSMPMKNGRGVTDDDITDLLHSEKRGVRKLKHNGDFRSDECIKYLKEADIICTNPPFSLFRDYLAMLVSYKKDFLIIGRETSVSYKEVFPLFKNNIVWYGYTHAKIFDRPDGTTKSFGNVTWFTNLDVKKRHEKLVLYRDYQDGAYYKYENFDGIDIPAISEIPKDYDGIMGVPQSFMFSYNPEQFEIYGYGKGTLAKDIGVTRNYRGRSDLAIKDSQGKNQCPFARILINRDDINNLKVEVPDLETQKKIVRVLSALDQKIELNHKISNNLLRISHQVYLKEIKGTATARTEKLGRLCRIKYGKGLPTSKVLKNGYRVYGGNGIIGFYNEKMYDESQVLISCRGAASGKVIFTRPECFVTNNSLILECDEKYHYFVKEYSLDTRLETGQVPRNTHLSDTVFRQSLD